MKRQLLLRCSPVLLSIALLTSCTKKEALLTQPEKDRIPKTEFYGDGLYDALGYGYNVTGEFANDPAVRNAVIDLAKFKTDNPTRLITENIRSQDFKLEYGENARKYSEMISKRVDATVGLALFKASVTTTFSSSNASDYKYIYGSYDLMIKHKRLRVNAVNTLLSNYLTNDFKTDLQNMTAAQLVNTYGTHVLIDMYTGAKLELKYQAETNNEDRSRASSVGIKAGVSLSIVGLQATVGTQQDINESRQNYSQKLMFRTRGGDPSKGLFGEFNLGSSAPPIDIRNWQQSSTIDNAVLIDIAPQGLLPLYELITNPAKRSEVEAYIKKYLIDNQVNLTYEPVPIHCYYNARTNKHTYELDRGLDNDPFNWFYKGVWFYAYKYQAPGTVPVYHYYAPSTQDNQYSLSTDNDYNYWTMRGIKFYAYNAPSPTQKPVWQYYTSNAHFLSISPDSGGPGWGKYIAFYFPG